MRKETYVMAFGWGVKEKYFSNSYGDTRILTVRKNKDGSLKFSTIKSNGGNMNTRYVRFLTEQEAWKFINDKLPNDTYTVYRCKSERILGLVDPEYGLYMAGVTSPAGIKPARYDINGNQIQKKTDITSTLTVDDIIQGLKSSVGFYTNYGSTRSSYFYYDTKAYREISNLLQNMIDDKLDLHISNELYINKINKISESDINFDCEVEFSCMTNNIENSSGTDLSDWWKEYGRSSKDEKLYDKYSIWISKPVKVNIDISLKDFISKMKAVWDLDDKTLQVNKSMRRALPDLIVDKLKNNPTRIKNIVASLDKHIKNVIEFLDSYDETEEFIESYNKKDIKNILYDLYDNKIK